MKRDDIIMKNRRAAEAREDQQRARVRDEQRRKQRGFAYAVRRNISHHVLLGGLV